MKLQTIIEATTPEFGRSLKRKLGAAAQVEAMTGNKVSGRIPPIVGIRVIVYHQETKALVESILNGPVKWEAYNG